MDRIEADLHKIVFSDAIAKMRHACPACANRQPDEEPLEGSALFCIDGNNSLKRMQNFRRHGDQIVNVERPDKRNRMSDFFLEAIYVDQFKDEVKPKANSKGKGKGKGKTTACLLFF